MLMNLSALCKQERFYIGNVLFRISVTQTCYCPIVVTCQIFILNKAHLNIRSNFGTVRPVYENHIMLNRYIMDGEIKGVTF